MPDIDPQLPAELYDTALRFLVPSESDPHVKYLVELDSFSGNGECDCPAFNFPRKGTQFSKRDLCARRVTPEAAVAAGWVKLPDSGRMSDALRCKHIVSGRDEIATVTINFIAKHATKKNTAPTQQ